MAVAARTRLIAIAVAAVLLLAVAGVGAVRAAGAPELPPVAADQLLASTIEALSGPVVISGDVETTTDLGLPQIPAEFGGEGGIIAMVNGTQRFRVWHSADGVRIAHLLQVSERDLVVNQDEAWWWDSNRNEAVRLSFADVRSRLATAPGSTGWMAGGDTAGPVAATAADPTELSRAAIDAVAPFASVAVEGTDEVAGRACYRLVLRPTSDGTLVDAIVLDIDAESRLPLRFAVVSRTTGEPGLSAGFTSVSFDPIDASVFAFTPPAGATVRDALDGLDDPATMPDRPTDREPEPVSFGTGFETRVAIPVGADLPPEVNQLLPYAGPLVSITIVRADDGNRWLLAGSVPLDILERDAQRLP